MPIDLPNLLKRSHLFGVFLILIIKTSPSVAQEFKEPSKSYALGLRYSHGFVIQHDRQMAHLAQGSVQGVELEWIKNTRGRKEWEQWLNFPDIGFGAGYYDYGNPILGQSIGLYSYVNYFLLRSQKFDLTFRLGTGIGIHTRPYHPENNNKNIAIGGPITYNMHSEVGGVYKINDHWHGTTQLMINHFSLADFSKPNKGINVLQGVLGLRYYPHAQSTTFHKNAERSPFSRRLYYVVSASLSLKENTPLGSGRHPVGVLSIHGLKQVSHASHLSLGLDYVHNHALRQRIRFDQNIPNQTDFRRLAISGGHELEMNKIRLITQVGWYFYRPFDFENAFFQRYGLNYYFTEHCFTKLYLNTQLARADFAEWGLGYRF